MSEENKDKRSFFTDALETLGTIIDDNQKRDAIHLAVEPVIAMDNLYPGDHVNVNGEKRRPYEDDAVGIVDPFLKAPSLLRDNGVRKGERFWLVLYPRTIKSLRHVWEHPAFPPSEGQITQQEKELTTEIQKSKEWIENYVKEIQEWDNDDNHYGNSTTIRDYHDLMNAADRWVNSDDDVGGIIKSRIDYKDQGWNLVQELIEMVEDNNER
jgi:hypothetical protein